MANLCVTTKLKLPPSCSKSVSVNLAVCCVDMASMSEAYELRIIYKPVDKLNLRDFHHAVTSLLPSTMCKTCSGHGQVSSLGSLLQLRDGLLSWGRQHSGKKIIMISSLFVENTASSRQILMEAADHCIAIDFIQVSHQGVDQSFLEQGSQQQSLPDIAVNIGEFENCTFQQVAWGARFSLYPIQCFLSFTVYPSHDQDMVNNIEGPMEVTIFFREKLFKDRDTVFCSLRPLLIQLADTIEPCQTCRCHGAVIDPCATQRTGSSKFLCPYTGQELDNHDFTSNGIKVGTQTVLYLPSFKSPPEPAKSFTSPRPTLVFSVLKCIALNTLSEGLLFGDPYILVPSSEVDLDDDVDNLEINDGVFASLCQALYSQDCGLLCTSSSDIDMMVEKSLPCYYLLLPAENRSFLAKRIAASEEFLQLLPPELKNHNIPAELRDSVSSCLSKIGVQSYNPLNHERGLHAKLNWLAKESLQFRPLPTHRAHIGKSGQFPLSQKMSYFNDSSQLQPSETSFAVESRDNDIRIPTSTSSTTSSVRGSTQAKWMHQAGMPKHAAPKYSSSMTSPLLSGAHSTSFSQLSLKPLLPLQTCPKYTQNQIMSSRPDMPHNQRPSELAKPASEPAPLKANFRRIKQGKV